jgi:hypothetical protein
MGGADYRTEVAPVEMRLLVGDHVRLDVPERGVGLVLDAVVERLDDVPLGPGSAGKSRNHGFAGREGVQALDLAGPLDVFAEATGLLPDGDGYDYLVLATQRTPIRASNGMKTASPPLPFLQIHSCS